MKSSFTQRECRKHVSVKVRASKVGWVTMVNYLMINPVLFIRENEP